MSHGKKKRSHSRSKSRKCPKPCEKKCDATKVIDESPYTITKSGNYCLTEDLQASTMAIKIIANDVNLDLSNHTIIITSDTANGIIISSSSRVIVSNGSIIADSRYTDLTNIGIYVNESTDVELVNMRIVETGYGVYINASTDVTMTDLNLYNSGAGEVRAVDSTGIVINESYIENIINDLAVAGVRYDGTNNVVIRNTQFKNSDIYANSGSGLFIDGVTSVTDDDTYFYGLFQFGFAADIGTPDNERGFNNGIVQNSSFSNINSLDAGPTAVFAVSGDNWKFTNCSFECNRLDGAPTETATFAVGGNPAFPNLFGAGTDTISFVRNMLIDTCTFTGASNWVYLAASNRANSAENINITVQNCNISGGVNAGVELYEENEEVIQNCKIMSNEIGVYLTNNSIYNAILQNTISDNTIGLQIDAGSDYNLIKENNIFYNGTNFIDNGTGTNFVNNTIY